MAVTKKIVKKWNTIADKIEAVLEEIRALDAVAEEDALVNDVVNDLEDAIEHVGGVLYYFRYNFPEVARQFFEVPAKRDSSKVSVKNEQIGKRIDALMSRSVPTITL